MSSFKINRVVPVESEANTPKHQQQQRKQNDADDESYTDSDEVDTAAKIKFCGSIKFWLIFMISFIVSMSVLLLMSISLSSFVPSIVEISRLLRTAEFKEIIAFTEQTFREVSIASDSITYQLKNTLDFNNWDQAELLTYQGFKTEWKYHQGLIVTSYVGDNLGTCLGIINWGGIPTLLNITTVDQKLYYCNNFNELEYCNRSSTPNEVLGFFDLSNLVAACDSSPGAQIYTKSYIDITMPQYTFISLLNCLKPKGVVAGGHKFERYFGLDLSVETISKFLSKKTMEVRGSKSFIVEIDTSYVVAIDDSTITLAEISSAGAKRKEYLQLNTPRFSEITAEMAERGMTNLTAIIPKCNTKELFEFRNDYVSMHRMCTDSKLDWMIVFTVPKWNYIGSIIISLIASVVGALIIMIIGLIVSIVVSIKIVTPFYNLIELFESVAHMDLDDLDVLNSSFTEVKHLQGQFLQMVGRIKLYRAFIPSHLLSQLEQRNGAALNPNNNQKSISSFKPEKSHKSFDKQMSTLFSLNKSPSGYSGSYHSHNMSGLTSKNSSKKKKYSHSVDMFSLHLIKKKITIMCCHLEGLSELLKLTDSTISSDIIVTMLSDVFDQVNTLCRTSGGHVGPFENDCITISYNASSNQEKHQEKAAQGCVFLLEKLNSTKQGKWPSVFGSTQNCKDILAMLNFKFAILYNEVCCGNVGTNEMKNFAIISSARTNFEIMLETTKRLGISIVITDRLQKSISTSFNTRLVDEKLLLNEEVYTAPSFETNNGNNQYEQARIYELGECISNNVTDEWMYELKDKERKARWNVYNQASQYYVEGEYQIALNMFNEYQQIKNNEHDMAVHAMIARCEKMINK